MGRSLVLAYWELQRIRRSPVAVLLAVMIPIAAVAAGIAFPITRLVIAIKCFFPVLAVFMTCMLLCLRSLADHQTGFAWGLESTPSAGIIVFAGRLITGITIILLQCGVFYLIANLIL